MRSLGRPAGYADTPLDDQQRHAGTLCCSMLLLDKSVCTPDAQCNAKMCALAESLQRMYDLTYMDDPRSELESMLSSSIDAELPFALERKYVPHHV